MSLGLTLVIHKQDPLEFAISGPANRIVEVLTGLQRLEELIELANESSNPHLEEITRLLNEANNLCENAVRYAHDPEGPR